MENKPTHINNLETSKNLADKLDLLQKEALRDKGLDGEVIEYVNWIVQDLRQGDFQKAQINYRNQSDKYDQWPHIKEFLLQHGIAEKFDPSKYFVDEE